MENTPTAGKTYSPAYAAGESARSAVSWAAVIAGAVAAAALSLMLLSGGVGLGLVSMSPWAGEGASAVTLGVGAIIWMIVTQIIAYGFGGYVAGRLRTRWTDIHSDEVYFRDTAHGFLVWALSAVISAVLLGSVLASVAGGTARLGATAAAGAGTAAVAAVANGAQGGGTAGAADYFVDTLFRSEQPNPDEDATATRAEVGRIVGASIARGDMTPEDRTYVAKVVSARTGLDQAAAEKRVSDAVSRGKQAADEAGRQARDAADKARQAAAAFSLWAFASLLIGAFVASWMATVGGRTRDS